MIIHFKIVSTYMHYDLVSNTSSSFSMILPLNSLRSQSYIQIFIAIDTITL